MSPTDLERDSADLRALLQAAAADLEVETPHHLTDGAASVDLAVSTTTGPRRATRQFVLGVAAAVAAVVVAVSILAATATDSSGGRVDAGPAQQGLGPTVTDTGGPPSTASAPDASSGTPSERWFLEQGIWRLPEPASGYRVTVAMTMSAVRPPFLVALDERRDPVRFVAVSLLHAGNLGAAQLERQERVGAAVVRQYAAGDDPRVTWFEVVSADNDQDGFVIASRGVDRSDVWAHASDLAALTFPDGRAYGVTLTPATVGDPRATQVAWELTEPPFGQAEGAGLPPELVSGDDMVVFAADGTRISVGGTNSPPGTSSDAELAAVLQSLRSLDEATVRTDLANGGIAFGSIEPEVPTTSVP